MFALKVTFTDAVLQALFVHNEPVSLGPNKNLDMCMTCALLSGKTNLRLSIINLNSNLAAALWLTKSVLWLTNIQVCILTLVWISVPRYCCPLHQF